MLAFRRLKGPVVILAAALVCICWLTGCATQPTDDDAEAGALYRPSNEREWRMAAY